MRYLAARIPMILLAGTIVPSRAEALCPGTIAPCDAGFPGDFDADGDVDDDDFEIFKSCAMGPALGPVAAGCEGADLDGDGDVDHVDFGLWQLLLTGSCDCPPLIQEPPNGQPSGPMQGVHLFSGEYYITSVDHRIRGRGIDFVWARKYRSRIGPDTEQGHGWDYSYNIRIEQVGRHLRVFDGNTRADVYRDQGDGTWSRHELAHVLQQTAADTYRLLFPDRSAWNFRPLDGSPAAGKIASMTDRHGNALHFQYDALGRLSTILDTLHTSTNPRAITVAYNAAGRIESVSDFLGRQVRYEYYDGIESGGGAGDLKSVRSPIVTGTPTQNDFPAGKTTVYTYSTGIADERLNHNLLTVTDPRGQTWLTNTYYATTDPNDSEFDRISRQIVGAAGDILDVVYVPQTPEPSNDFAVMLAVVNDRVGNVSHWAYDKSHRLMRARHSTGRADPDQPTTLTTNLPQNPLRPGDPPYFETRYDYNADSRPTLMVHPNGNEETFVYDESNPNPRARGNLLEHCRDPGPLGGDQPQICESYEYDPVINFDTNFVTRHVDGRGHQTLHLYDANGNRTHTTHRLASIAEEFEYNPFGQLTAHVHPGNGSGHRRRDEFIYHTGGPSMGYLHQVIVDAGSTGFFNLTTTYEYDAVGNVTRVIDPRGNDTLLAYNALDQLVRAESRPILLPNGTTRRFETNYYYDANDNLVRFCRENVNEQGVLDPANPYITAIVEYDLLDQVTRTCEESGSFNVPTSPPQLDCAGLPDSRFIKTEYEYDANENLERIRLGEAVAGRQPGNETHYLYDERDLLFREIRGPATPDQSTAGYDYDGNGNLTITYTGLESPDPRVTHFVYDGYDRPTSSTDPMGNVVEFQYDANSNRGKRLTKAELIDVLASGTGNVRLDEVAFVHDPMDRVTHVIREYFDPATQAPFFGGTSETTFVYNPDGRLLSIADPNGNLTTYTYDTAGRTHAVNDAAGNTAIYGYDDNSNTVSLFEQDISSIGSPVEMFLTTWTYDALNRLTGTTDNIGNQSHYTYDSRDNLTRTIDPRGNVVRFTHDARDRLTRTQRDLTDTGDGNGAVIGTIINTRTWDDSHRVVTESDDNGHTTTYDYDPLNRRITTEFADCTTRQAAYDVHDNVIQITNPNGTVATHTYDLLDRLISSTYTPGAGVAATTTYENYLFDGLSRLRSAENDVSLVTFDYDSLGNVRSQNQDGHVTAGIYDAMGNKLSSTYPSGRFIQYNPDQLSRTSTIRDNLGNVLVAFDYIGPHRVERISRGNGVSTLYTYNGNGHTSNPNPSGDFGVKQVARTQHFVTGGPMLDERTYQWDRSQNKTQRVDVTPGRSATFHDYGYDSASRLTRATVASPGPPDIIRDTEYVLDGAHNRIEVIENSTPLTYFRDPTLCEPADYQMNQYTSTPSDHRIYDANGNLQGRSTSPSVPANFQYDVHNRLVQYTSPTAVIASYTYDALGRRLSKTLQTLSSMSTRKYLWGDDPGSPAGLWQVIEERDGTGALLRAYTYGDGLEEILHAATFVGDFFYHQDDLGNVVALTNLSAGLIERYDYDDFGKPDFFDPAGTLRTGSLVGNTILFAGRSYDHESNLYDFRLRHYDPAAGRYTSPIWTDHNTHDPGRTEYAGGNPWTLVNPMGANRAGRSRGFGFVEMDSGHEGAPPFGSRLDALVFAPSPDTTRRVKPALKPFVGGNIHIPPDETGTTSASKPKEIVVVGSKVKEVIREAGLRSDGELVQAVSDSSAGGKPFFKNYRPQFYIRTTDMTERAEGGWNDYMHQLPTRTSGDTGNSASGLPTGKRQHKPVVVTKPVDKADAQVKVKFPWLANGPGAARSDWLNLAYSAKPVPKTREHILLARQVGVPVYPSSSGGSNTGKRKQSLYFPEQMLEEISEPARSVSAKLWQSSNFRIEVSGMAETSRLSP